MYSIMLPLDKGQSPLSYITWFKMSSVPLVELSFQIDLMVCC